MVASRSCGIAGPFVVNLDQYLIVLIVYCNTNVLCLAVLNRVRYQVRDHLRQTLSVPLTSQVPASGQVDDDVRVSALQLIHDVMKD